MTGIFRKFVYGVYPRTLAHRTIMNSTNTEWRHNLQERWRWVDTIFLDPSAGHKEPNYFIILLNYSLLISSQLSSVGVRLCSLASRGWENDDNRSNNLLVRVQLGGVLEAAGVSVCLLGCILSVLSSFRSHEQGSSMARLVRSAQLPQCGRHIFGLDFPEHEQWQ